MCKCKNREHHQPCFTSRAEVSSEEQFSSRPNYSLCDCQMLLFSSYQYDEWLRIASLVVYNVSVDSRNLLFPHFGLAPSLVCRFVEANRALKRDLRDLSVCAVSL